MSEIDPLSMEELSAEDAALLTSLWQKGIAEESSREGAAVFAPSQNAQIVRGKSFRPIGQINIAFIANPEDNRPDGGDLNGADFSVDLTKPGPDGVSLGPTDRKRIAVLATWSGITALNTRARSGESRDWLALFALADKFLGFLGVLANFVLTAVNAWKKFAAALLKEEGPKNIAKAHASKAEMDQKAKDLPADAKPSQPSQNFPKKRGLARNLSTLYDRASGTFTPREDSRSGMLLGFGTEDGKWYEPPEDADIAAQMQEFHPDNVDKAFKLPPRMTAMQGLWIGDPENRGHNEMGSNYGVLYFYEEE